MELDCLFGQFQFRFDRGMYSRIVTLFSYFFRLLIGQLSFSSTSERRDLENQAIILMVIVINKDLLNLNSQSTKLGSSGGKHHIGSPSKYNTTAIWIGCQRTYWTTQNLGDPLLTGIFHGVFSPNSNSIQAHFRHRELGTSIFSIELGRH